MSTDSGTSRGSRPAAERGRFRLERLLRYPAVLAGVLLAAIVLLTVVDVALRYLANAPITGGLEMTELAMVALIMLALPYCSATGGHVRVDVLERLLGRSGRVAGEALSGTIGAIVLGALAWNTAFKAADAYEYHDRVNTLLVPLWPFYALIALSMAACALVVLHDLVRLASGRAHDHV